MAPAEKFRLPFRWQFIPVKDGKDGSVRWTWSAFTQTGEEALKSGDSFDTLTECIEDARSKGYGKP